MQKFGTVTCQKGNYQFVWTLNESGHERIEILQDVAEYNYVDTSNCIAAYYRKTKEMFYGDEVLLRLFLRIKNTASTFNALKVDDFDFSTGKVISTSKKEDAALGLYWECVMENGISSKETFRTPEGTVEVISSNKVDSVVAPLNLSQYTVYSLTTDQTDQKINEDDYYSLEYLKAKYPNINHIEENDYVVVGSLLEADARLRAFREAPTKVKAIDFETTGTGMGIYGPDVITGAVLSYEENESTYYPFRQEKFEYNLPISFLREILDAINNQPKDVVIVAYNGKFEIQCVWKEYKNYVKNSEYARNWDPECEAHGLDNPFLRIDADPFYMSIICNPVFKQKGAHTLKAEAFRADGKFYLELKDIFKNSKAIRFNVLPPEIVRYYACPDAPNTIKVYKRLLSLLPQGTLGIANLENAMIYVTAENEFYGMRTDVELLVDLINNEQYKIDLLSDMFKKAHHTNKNINSPEVKREIFYDKLRCPVEVRTKTGLPSTSNKALKRILELGTLRNYDKNNVPPPIVDLHGRVIIKGEKLVSNKYPSLVILDQYNKSLKQLGAYKRIQRTSQQDRVMFYMNQYGAATGRRTSDAHQYSDGMKMLIHGDSKYHRLWSADFKQIELRLLAYLAGQKDLIEMMSNPDIDVHRAITSIITKQEIWAISADERKRRKSTNFGVVYMMSEYGLASTNVGPAYTDDDVNAARKSITDFYAGLPQINRFVVGNEEFVRKKGFMQTKFGRIREFKELLDPTYPESKKKSMVRAANNMPVQGFGADLLKIVELNVKQYIKKMGWDKKVDCDGVELPLVRLMLSIHDEILVSSHESIPIPAIITMFKECMELKVKGAPPFFAAPAMVNSWFDGKLDAYELDLRYRDVIVEDWVSKQKQSVHAESYCISRPWDEVHRKLDRLSSLRKQLLKSSDYVDSKLKISAETKAEFLRMLDTDADFKQFCYEHAIPERESYDSEEKKLDVVITRCLDKEFYPYLEDLKAFRSKRLSDWMDGLIAEYETVEQVAEHAHHDELTHTLISIYIKKDEKFEHIEAIHEATKRYMEQREASLKEQGMTLADMIASRQPSVKEKVEDLKSFEQLEEYIHFDENGEAVYEETEDDNDDESTIREISYFARPVERTRIIYSLTEAFIDLNDMKASDLKTKKVYDELLKVFTVDGAYRVFLMIDGQMKETDFYINYEPDMVDKVIEDIVEVS